MKFIQIFFETFLEPWSNSFPLQVITVYVGIVLAAILIRYYPDIIFLGAVSILFVVIIVNAIKALLKAYHETR